MSATNTLTFDKWVGTSFNPTGKINYPEEDITLAVGKGIAAAWAYRSQTGQIDAEEVDRYFTKLVIEKIDAIYAEEIERVYKQKEELQKKLRKLEKLKESHVIQELVDGNDTVLTSLNAGIEEIAHSLKMVDTTLDEINDRIGKTTQKTILPQPKNSDIIMDGNDGDIGSDDIVSEIEPEISGSGDDDSLNNILFSNSSAQPKDEKTCDMGGIIKMLEKLSVKIDKLIDKVDTLIYTMQELIAFQNEPIDDPERNRENDITEEALRVHNIKPAVMESVIVSSPMIAVDKAIDSIEEDEQEKNARALKLKEEKLAEKAKLDEMNKELSENNSKIQTITL